ncbi:MAG: hypothetical protein GY855_14240 [candidate division Zixibacteria bacterium]|nr:hypothetical protein [candidate division Zixibacteria bacterium]
MSLKSKKYPETTKRTRDFDLLMIADSWSIQSMMEVFEKSGIKANIAESMFPEKQLIEEIEINDIELVFSINCEKSPPSEVFNNKKLRWVNLQFGKIPKYCGKYPVQRAIINCETELEVTLHYIDTVSGYVGIIDTKSIPILMEDTAFTLYNRSLQEGFGLIKDNLHKLKVGNVKSTERISCATSLWDREFSDTEFINWNSTAFKIHNQIRAYTHPFNGAKCSIHNGEMTIWKTVIGNPLSYYNPGTILEISKNKGIITATGSGEIHIIDYEISEEIELKEGDCFDGMFVDRHEVVCEVRSE